MNANRQAYNDCMRDLIDDIRAADRDELPRYAARCRRDFRKLWDDRSDPLIELCGIPASIEGGYAVSWLKEPTLH